MANHCIYCGAALAPGDRFCRTCGRSLPPDPVIRGPQTPPGRPVPPVMQPQPQRQAAPYQQPQPQHQAPSYQQPQKPTPPQQPAKPAEKPRRSGAAIALSIVLSVIMVIELALVAFWQPGFLRSGRGGSGNDRTTANTDPRKSTEKPGGEIEDPEWPYHSKALDITPVKGFHVTAEAGALYDDTEIVVKEVGDEDYERLAAISEDLEKDGKLMIGAWEVNAGLGEDECLPGGYHVSIDLSTLEIPESLYPAVELVRITDSGTIQTYHSEIEGSTLSYDARQNSLAAILITVGVIAIISLGVYLRNKPDVYYVFKGDKGEKEVEHDGIKYTVRWLMRDVDPDQQKTLDRIAELQNSYQKTAQEDYDEEEAIRKYSSALYRMFNKNKSVAERLQELIADDKEYQSLVQTLEVPELVQTIIGMINTSYDYLRDVELVKLPDYDLDYYLQVDKKDSSNYGESDATVLRRAWVRINVAEAEEIIYDTDRGKTAKDNMLLTITHELFHVCQNMYHSRLLGDSERFDEMVTLVLESDAKNWYTEQGIITTDPTLTLADQWNYLTLSIDGDNKVMGPQGYTLSNLVQYLRKATGKESISAVHLMMARRFYKTPVTSEPLMKAFKLTQEEFYGYYRDFCIAHKKDIAGMYIEKSEHANKLPLTAFDPKEGTHISFSTLGDYTAAVRGFTGEKKEKSLVPLLLVFDQGALEAHPECAVEPVTDYVKTGSGFYVKAISELQKAPRYMKSYGQHFILEVYGKGGKSDGLGYTLYRMLEPEAPKLSLKEGMLEITLPEPTGAAKDKVLDGIQITIQASDGTKKEVTARKDEIGTVISVPVDQLKDKKTEGTPNFKVSISEFVNDLDGKRCFGLPSKEAEVKGSEPEWVNGYEYFNCNDPGALFQAMKEANVLAMRVRPLGFYAGNYYTKKDQVYPIDNMELFEIDMTDGAVTEWTTTFTIYEKKQTYTVTFTAAKNSLYGITAVIYYSGSKEGKTPGNAMVVMPQIGDIPEIKNAFSVNRANTQRMLFEVEAVLVP